MNRKETRLLVENWRKLLKQEDVNSQESDLLEEGKALNFLGGLAALGASFFLSPKVGNALNPNQVEQGIERAFQAEGKDDVSVEFIDDDTIKIKWGNGKSKKYKIPDTSGYEGSYYNEWFKKRILSVKDWHNFIKVKNELSAFDSRGDRLFLDAPGVDDESTFEWFSGAQYRSDLTKKYSDLLEELNSKFAHFKSEIFQMGDNELYLITYTKKNGMPDQWIQFDLEKINSALDYINKMHKSQRSKKGQTVDTRFDLRTALRKSRK